MLVGPLEPPSLMCAPTSPAHSPAALLRHVDHGALQHAQQRLLHALAAHVARDGDVLAALGDLVDLRDGNGRRPELELAVGQINGSGC